MPNRTGSEALIRIVLADDHTVMRNGLRRLLDDERDLEVVAEAADTATALQMVRGHRPDVLVLDLNMPGGSTRTAMSSIRRFAPHTRIIVLSMERDHAAVASAYEAGASAYISKEAAAEQLVSAIRSAEPRLRPGPAAAG